MAGSSRYRRSMSSSAGSRLSFEKALLMTTSIGSASASGAVDIAPEFHRGVARPRPTARDLPPRQGTVASLRPSATALSREDTTPTAVDHETGHKRAGTWQQ